MYFYIVIGKKRLPVKIPKQTFFINKLLSQFILNLVEICYSYKHKLKIEICNYYCNKLYFSVYTRTQQHDIFKSAVWFKAPIKWYICILLHLLYQKLNLKSFFNTIFKI